MIYGDQCKLELDERRRAKSTVARVEIPDVDVSYLRERAERSPWWKSVCIRMVDASRLTALLLPRISPIFSVVDALSDGRLTILGATPTSTTDSYAR